MTKQTKRTRKTGRAVWRLALCLILFLAALQATACQPQDPIEGGATMTDKKITDGPRQTPVPTEPDRATVPKTTSFDARPTMPSAGETVPCTAYVVKSPPLSSKIGVTDEPVILRSKAEYDTFMRSRRQGWQFTADQLETLGARYSETFFDERALIVGAVGAGSGSTLVEVKGVTDDGTHLIVNIALTAPEIGTMDMMSWHYFVDVAADAADGRTAVSTAPPTRGRPIAGIGFEIADM